MQAVACTYNGAHNAKACCDDHDFTITPLTITPLNLDEHHDYAAQP